MRWSKLDADMRFFQFPALLLLCATAAAQDVLDFHPPNPLPMPQECIPRGRLPEVLRILVPKPEGRSGLQIGGTQDGKCHTVPHCIELSQSEFEKLFDRALDGYMDFVKVPIAACKTTEDLAEDSRRARSSTRELSEYAKDSRIKVVMEQMLGEWCGRIEKPWAGTKSVMEIRFRVLDDNGMFIARPVQTWQRIPDGPLGEHGYVTEFELIPWRHWDPGGVQLRGVHERHAGDYWYAFPSEKGIKLDGGQWKFTLSRDCSGYWKAD